ncbi:hypothetical protein M5D96_005899, partial [Drosophila gunungcola]
ITPTSGESQTLLGSRLLSTFCLYRLLMSGRGED